MKKLHNMHKIDFLNKILKRLNINELLIFKIHKIRLKLYIRVETKILEDTCIYNNIFFLNLTGHMSV